MRRHLFAQIESVNIGPLLGTTTTAPNSCNFVNCQTPPPVRKMAKEEEEHGLQGPFPQGTGPGDDARARGTRILKFE